MKPNQERAFHKAQLYRLLTELLDCKIIAPNIFFKGGTCATMLGFLDRFSVDLDFDLRNGASKDKLRKELHRIFEKLNLKIKDESKKALQFFLSYQAPEGQRNTIKLEIYDNFFKTIDYKAQYLRDIDRMAVCQTLESIVANKLVAPIDRYKNRETVAGRDIYDIHYFLSHGFDFKEEIIEERTGKDYAQYFRDLISFIKDNVTQNVINQDLNFLLPYEKFSTIRKTLKIETLVLLQDIIEE